MIWKVLQINDKNCVEKIDKLKNNLTKFENTFDPRELSEKQEDLYLKSLGILADIDKSECK